MRISFLRAVMISVTIFLAGFSFAQETRRPSTREERADAVRYAKLLERDPFNKDAKKIREQFTEWLTEIPDLTFDFCPSYLEPLYKTKKNFAPLITTQFLMSGTAYMIDHPDDAGDKVAINLAGVEGALKAYENILEKKPKAHWEFLDDLLAKRDRGDLRAYVQTVAAKCPAKK